MKIGILTQPLHNNYGGLLQNYALQTVLKSMGHEVWTVNRIFPEGPLYREYASFTKRGIKKVLRLKNSERLWLSRKERKFISANTAAFVKNNISTTAAIDSTAQLAKTHQQYSFDTYIVGSDQVWRPEYSPCITNYFLDFVENDKTIQKIAYAASFGNDIWGLDEKETETCARLIKEFRAVSVREKSGVDLCKKHLSVKAENVLDPTMLLSKEEYIDLINKSVTSQSNGNLFVYILDKDTGKQKIVSSLAGETGLKPFELMPKSPLELRDKKCRKTCIFPPVEQWLRSFMDAEFIITDSFHGTVFSIIFKKPFIVLANMERGLDRFLTLLQLFGLEDRIILDENSNNMDFVSLYDKAISYPNLRTVLENNREKSYNFLKTNLTK